MLQANTPHKPRILILDEDRIILQSLSQFLSREGYDVRSCDRPEDAFPFWRAHRSKSCWPTSTCPASNPRIFCAMSAAVRRMS